MRIYHKLTYEKIATYLIYICAYCIGITAPLVVQATDNSAAKNLFKQPLYKETYKMISSVSYSFDSRHIAISHNNKDKQANLTVINSQKGTRVASLLIPYDSPACKVMWSLDGKNIALAQEDSEKITIFSFDGKKLSQSRVLSNNNDGAASLIWISNNLLAAGKSEKENIEIWNTMDGKLIKETRYLRDSVGSLSLSKDGKYLASSSNQMYVAIFDTTDFTRKNIKTPHRTDQVAWAPDQLNLAISYLHRDDQGSVEIYKITPTDDTLKGESLGCIPSGRVNQILWSASGKYLFTTDEHQVVKIWDTTNLSAIQQPIYESAKDFAEKVYLSPDARQFVTVYENTVTTYTNPFMVQEQALLAKQGRTPDHVEGTTYLEIAAYTIAIGILLIGLGYFIKMLVKRNKKKLPIRRDDAFDDRLL